MPIENQKFVVYVDISYLINLSYRQRSGWERLLPYSKNCMENLKANPKLEIYIHQIVLEEYRTHGIAPSGSRNFTLGSSRSKR